MTTIRQDGSKERRPVILMTPDTESLAGAPTETIYAVRANYAQAIGDAGGMPLILPYEMQTLAAALDLADGVLITGTLPGVEASPDRRSFELALIEHAIRSGKPVLGICHGMQLIGEWLGGTFNKGLPAGGDETVEHLPSAVPDRFAHRIHVEAASVLDAALGTREILVNSLHRHALTGTGRFRVVARAPDGVIEAFEGETKGFCLGIQWHPEYRLSEFDRSIFRIFVEESANDALQRKATGTSLLVRDRLAALGFPLPDVSVPPGAFVGAILTDNTVTVSGQVPLKNGAVLKRGHLGDVISVEEGRECARWALLNALAQLERIAGGLDRIKGFVRLAGYVAATADFTEHGAVVDGASELLREAFPGCWPHARIAIGVGSLPRGVPVEVELTAILADLEN
ncbi:Atu1372/SO_1960 family protein [Rhizobium sp. BR 314]|uniref:Atu1372/SO_1960 family protein n=1 Tax=Rhizobium sp. BR 314 TaxID=3040013 RepID=UPI0039BF26F5